MIPFAPGVGAGARNFLRCGLYFKTSEWGNCIIGNFVDKNYHLRREGPENSGKAMATRMQAIARMSGPSLNLPSVVVVSVVTALLLPAAAVEGAASVSTPN